MTGNSGPPENTDDNSGGDGSGGPNLFVGTLNYTASDLTELRRLAQEDPELARQVVSNQDRQHAREERSFLLGMVVSFLLAVSVVGGGTIVLINLGWWQTILFVLVLLGASHLLRAFLKGEFADTSWFGAFLSGSKPPDD